MTIDIPDKLYNDIVEFCKINSFDFDKKIVQLILQGFTIAKYGLSPFKREELSQVEEIMTTPKKSTRTKKTVAKEVNKEKEEIKTESTNIEPTPKTRKVKIIKA